MNNSFTELSLLGLIKISGPDAEKFLQGQVTCDALEITAQQSRLGAHCDHKGRVQAIFRLFKYQNNFYLQLPKTLISHLTTLLKKYAAFSKVTLEDVSNEWSQLGLSGPDYATLLNNSLPINIDAVNSFDDLIITHIPSFTLARYYLLGPTEKITQLAQQLNTKAQQQDFNAWQIQDIQAGIPTIFPETIGLFTPHQINLPAINGVSFTKGCYIGQEIVARMQYLGKLKQHMHKINFTCADNIIPGMGIFSNAQECGTLVQAVKLQENSWLGLAVITDNKLEEALFVGEKNNSVLNIEDLPYNVQQ